MSVYRITQLSQSEGTDELADRYDAGNQHFSLYHSQTIDFTGICTDYKNVSNSEVFKLFFRLLFLLKFREKRGFLRKSTLKNVKSVFLFLWPQVVIYFRGRFF